MFKWSTRFRSPIGEGSILAWSVVALTAAGLGLAGTLGALVAGMKNAEFSSTVQYELDRRGQELAAEIAPLLAEDRYAEARVLLLTAATGVDGPALSNWRIVGAGGAVVTASPAAAEAKAEAVGAVTARIPLAVPGRGAMTLQLESHVSPPLWTARPVRFVLMTVAAAAGVVLVITLLKIRSRLRALVLIRDALVSMASGERAHGALAVDARLGQEAVAWNQLLDECEQLRRESMSERARDSMHNRSEGRGELSQACDALWQGMVLVDEQFRVKYANGAAAVFLRSKKDDMGGAGIADFISDEQVLAAVREIATGQARRRTTHEIRRSDEEGGGILRFSIRPVRRDDAAAALVIIEDITQQRVADEARNAFVAQVTHELRTPLTNIRLYVEQAIEDGNDDPAIVAQALNVINQETRRLERIVGDMLSVSEIEAGSFKLREAEVRLDGLFDELAADYRAQAESKNITLTFHLPPKLPAIRGDRDKIVLALHNLVGNAIKYTPEGGAVDVRVEVDEAQLTVEVVDTGIGIDAREAELIFEKFYRSRDQRVGAVTGTGLGLALAREVVRLHGGDISVRSQVDRGSTFTLNLPTRAAA